MFPRKTLDTVILAILDRNPDGLSGYSLVKEIKKEFAMQKPPSPGTIYPILNKMKDAGLIREENKDYFLTDLGKAQLTDEIPGILTKTIEFMPQFYKILMDSLPVDIRLGFIGNPSFMGCYGNKINKHISDDSNFERQIDLDVNLGSTFERLQILKKQLEKTHSEIKKEMNALLETLEKRIAVVDKKLEECEKERDAWVKIEIEED